MKRTKEAYFRPNPTVPETQDSSGVTFLIGEDMDYHVRNREFQKQQKEALNEQIEQKKQIKHAEKQTHNNFDQQLLANTYQRGQLEQQKQRRLMEVERAHDEYNLALANQRKQKEALARQHEIQEQKRELQLLNQRKVKPHKYTLH